MAHDFYRRDPGPVTLDNCAREPIHVPGAIQPAGTLIAVDGAGTIRHIAANAPAWLGIDGEPEALIGAPLGAVLGDDAAERVLALRMTTASEIDLTGPNGGALDARVHRNGQGLRVVELERPTTGGGVRMAAVRRALTALRTASSREELYGRMAGKIQQLTAYHRVMVYRFEPDGHGEVIAEATGPDTSARFLGWRFPESDIPAQARRLYLRQLIRMIGDVDYTPSPLVPEERPDGTGVDLSDATLRSVSPIHLDYLRNMGVRSTLTASIVIDGKLWGLIVCHHRQPCWLPRATREAVTLHAEVFAALLQLELGDSVLEARRVAIDHLRSAQATAASNANSKPWPGQLAEHLEVFAEVVRADGAALLVADDIHPFGEVPSDEVLMRLVAVAGAGDEGALLISDRVPSDVSGLEAHTGPGCGVVGLPIKTGSDQPAILLLLRSERREEQVWGTSEDKGVVVDSAGVPRLSPAGSLGEFRRVVKGRSTPWTALDRAAIAELQHALLQIQVHRTAQLASSNAQLLQASEAKDTFLASLSHELRNPLQAMVGWSSLLKRGAVTPDKLPMAYATLHRSALAQQRLIDDLLDVSRIANGKLELRLEVLELADVLQAAVDMARPMFEGKNLRLQTLIGRCTPVEGDGVRVQQMMWNLLTNAARYTPDGGRVTVRLYPRDSHSVFEVEDNGVGMETDLIPQLFEQFQQASRGGQGLGLGLSIVKGLADLHQATIEADSPGPGMGSRFAIAFPALLGRKVEPVSGVAPEEEVDLTGVVAVVVDDQISAVSFVETLLNAVGATVHAFTDPAEALEHLANSPLADIVLSDIHMQPFDGYELVKRLRGLPGYAACPVVALTAYAQDEDRVRIFRAGFHAHLAKPVRPDELLALVASVTGRL